MTTGMYEGGGLPGRICKERYLEVGGVILLPQYYCSTHANIITHKPSGILGPSDLALSVGGGGSKSYFNVNKTQDHAV